MTPVFQWQRRHSWVALGVVAACTAPSVALAQIATGQGIEVPVGRIVLAFSICVLLAVIASLLLRVQGRVKWLRINVVPRRLRILESTRLGIRSSLIMVQADQRLLLLSADAHGIKLVADLGASSSAEAEP